MSAVPMSWYKMGGYLRLYLKNWRKTKFMKERNKRYLIITQNSTYQQLSPFDCLANSNFFLFLIHSHLPIVLHSWTVRMHKQFTSMSQVLVLELMKYLSMVYTIGYQRQQNSHNPLKVAEVLRLQFLSLSRSSSQIMNLYKARNCLSYKDKGYKVILQGFEYKQCRRQVKIKPSKGK